MRIDSIKDVMVKSPYIAEPGMTVDEAMEYMQECDIRHLPVMSGNSLVGVVSERDLERYSAHSSDENIFLEEVMVRKPYVAFANQPLDDVVLRMAEGKLGSALIVDNDKSLLGIFTTVDALFLLYELLNRDPSAKDYVRPTTLRELFLAA